LAQVGRAENRMKTAATNGWGDGSGREAAGVGPGFALVLVNFLFQRVFRVNGRVPWPVHFTSRVSSASRIGLPASGKPSFALSGGCYIQALNGIEFGEGSGFGAGVKMISANHDVDDLQRWKSAPPIRVGRGCWIGANAVLLPGVSLAEGSVVLPGSVVNRSVPEGAEVGGVPARIIRILPGVQT